MRTFLFNLSAVAVMSAGAAFAQQTAPSLAGTYVFYEQGAGVNQPIASIALVTFTSSGSVTGARYWRSPGSSYKSSLIGGYSNNPDGTVALALTATTMPTDGSDPLSFTVNYQLLLSKSKTKAINAIRTDNGFFTVAYLVPAATTNKLQGTYLFSESGNGAPYAGLGLLTLDGASNIVGTERVESIGVNTVNSITGNYVFGSDGFGTMTLNVPSVDVNGNNIITQTNYIFVNGADQVYAIRTDATSAFISNLSAQ